MITWADFCCGGGGFRGAAEVAGWGKCVVSNDNDRFCRKIYVENFPEDEKHFLSCSIQDVDPNTLDDFSVFVCGFPCQSFSIAGEKKGFYDTRGTVFHEIVRICAAKKPSVILLENVAHLRRHDRGRTWEVMHAELTRIGYRVYDTTVNGVQFGVPQNRPRFVAVCFRDGIGEGFVFPEPVVSAGNGVCLKNLPLDDDPKPQHYLTQDYLDYLKEHRRIHEEKKHGFGYLVNDLKGVAKTLVVGGMGRERNLISDIEHFPLAGVKRSGSIMKPLNTEALRIFTSVECRRLMGFSESYRIVLSETRAWKLFANSVIVPVFVPIMRNILRCF